MPMCRSDYPENWEALREQVLQRAGYRCECLGECGRAHDGGRCRQLHGQRSLFSTMEIVLTAVHLCTGETCDDQTKTTRKCGKLEHLKARCQACQRKLDLPIQLTNRRAIRQERKDQARRLFARNTLENTQGEAE